MSEEKKQPGQKRKEGSKDSTPPSMRQRLKRKAKEENSSNSSEGKGFQWKRAARTLVFWILFILIAIGVTNIFHHSRSDEALVTYSKYRELLEKELIQSAEIYDESEFHGYLKQEVQLLTKDGLRPYTRIMVNLGPIDNETIREWTQYQLDFRFEKKSINWLGILFQMLPWLLFIGFWLFVLRQMQAGPKGVFSFGKSRAKLLVEDRPKVTFKDVAGAEEAKQELQEIIEFLKDPAKFQRLGGRIPKGVLLMGPPGTGKTYMAKAVAGEAGVPFFSMSGSDFVEMFVGVGASRVRDLFLQGKNHAPCIIFIDEIDAVGRHRGAGIGGGHDEREQTLNQLLVEMDGFESNEGVILIAATNRPDVLDPALLRPGRFDRQVIVDLPDVKGREGILRVHTRNIPLAKNVRLGVLARGTPGLSGADLENLVNEAALLASRRNRKSVTMADFEEAKDKVMMGAARLSMVITEEEKRLIAYHEVGHALVSKLIPGSDPVHKVTIIPRGRALGVTHYLPVDEKHTYSKSYCMGKLAHALGGRCAEQLVFGELTTGSGNDYEQATALAHNMVCEWGMSERLGPLTYGKKEEEIFLGREIAQHRDYSEKTAQLIDEEVRRLVDEAEARATQILKENEDKLHAIAKALLEFEVLDGHQMDRILKGERLRKPAGRSSRPRPKGSPRRRQTAERPTSERTPERVRTTGEGIPVK